MITSTRLAALGLEQLGAAARRVGEGRIVERPDQPRLAHDVGQRLLLVPGVVAERQAVGAGVEQLARRGLGDAEAGGGVLGVDDDELQAQAPAQAGQVVGEAVAARAADHVAEEGQAHAPILTRTSM